MAMLRCSSAFAGYWSSACAGSFAVFATGRAYDQVRNTVCYSALDVKLRIENGKLRYVHTLTHLLQSAFRRPAGGPPPPGQPNAQ